MAKFFGTSSPKIICRTAAIAIAITARVGPGLNDTPGRKSSTAPIVSSARKPNNKEVTVIPSCAPPRWKLKRLSNFRTTRARRCPCSAITSTRSMSTATKLNSPATKIPLSAISVYPHLTNAKVASCQCVSTPPLSNRCASGPPTHRLKRQFEAKVHWVG